MRLFFGKVEDNLRRKQMINPLFESRSGQQVTGRTRHPSPDRRSHPGLMARGHSPAGRLPSRRRTCAG